MNQIADLSPTAPITTNEAGGKQSSIPYRLDLVPANAILSVAHILNDGEKKYGKNNWRKIERDDHLNHALIHIFALLSGDQQDNHLGHAACRMLMALEVELNPQGD